MKRAYKFRIYPNREQRVIFAKTFGCVRFIYNRMLADKIAAYRETGKTPMITPAQYKTQYTWLKEVDSLALTNAQLHLQSQTPTNKYYASILTEYENQVPEAELKKFVGLDFLMHGLYVTSDGERADYPRFLRRLERKLVHLYRKHSRTKQASYAAYAVTRIHKSKICR